MKQTPPNEPRKIARPIIALGLVIVAVILSILQGYAANWTGFGDFTTPNGEFVRGKTLWDWMELLVIPLSLLVGAFFLNQSERTVERQIAENRAKLEREIATDRQQEVALQAYLDRMTDLLLKENLRESRNEELLNVARIRTLTVLPGLDAKRKRMVLLFLYESRLIVDEPVIALKEADISKASLDAVNLGGAKLSGAFLGEAILTAATLTGADLKRVYLWKAQLNGARLAGADLSRGYLHEANFLGADLTGADLSATFLTEASLKQANLTGANLRGANLTGADLSNTILLGTIVTDEQLMTAKSLKGAIMQDGTKHD